MRRLTTELHMDHRHWPHAAHVDEALNTNRRHEVVTDVSGARLLMAVATGVALAAALGLSTAYGLPRLAPAWGDTNPLTAVIVLEVYLAIIVGHVIAFNGLERLRSAVRLRPTTSRQLLAAFAVCIAIW